MQATDANTIEWILDSDSQANVCGDLSPFTTLREDKTSKLDFANGTSEHANMCGSVLLQILNEATGELEDRRLDDVMYLPSAKVNIISLGYLQTTGKFKLTCSPDQQIVWLSKPGTTLKFKMTANHHRMRVKKVTDVMVMAAVKPSMDSKRSMELLHQRFGHMGMSTVKLLASKLDVGIEINAKDLSFYDCVACAAVVLPRLRAMLTATHLPNSLWGDALFHVVATLNWLPTKPLGLVSPHQKLFKTEPNLDDLRTWGCIAHVRVPPESRQKKEKLEPRARLCLLLGYSDNTIGYKFLDLMTAQVVTARGGNVTFHEEYMTDGTYVRHLMQNAFADGDHKLPETVPVARIKTSMDTYLPDRTVASASAAKPLDIVSLEDKHAEHVQSSDDCQRDADSPVCDRVESQPDAAVSAGLQVPVKAPESVAKARMHRKCSGLT
ncbi:unnamed protein product [Phytophthora fragariaefolia]|uniref:Unnamed protein product n=1 Tax=Phytophthora fragariaefolia TaxID=1490495 RepID=A0A9W6Y0B6_9STRA|nr:unnamed protein product [Phytophthora fragariaefolia]